MVSGEFRRREWPAPSSRTNQEREGTSQWDT